MPFCIVWKCRNYCQFQNTVLEVQFRSVKYTVITRIRKNCEQLLIPVQAIQGDYSLLMQTTHVKRIISNSFQMGFDCVYLFRLFDKSIIISLTDDSTNICSEISKIWLILWKVCTWNMKANWRGWRKLKSWVEMNVLCIVDEMRDLRRAYH